MLSKTTLELAIELIGQAVYTHSSIPHDPLYRNYVTAYGELRDELKKLEEGHRICSIIVETETKNMSE